MFGIEDPGIYLAYLIAILCVVFAVWFGISNWNRDEEDEEEENGNNTTNTHPEEPTK